MATTIEASSHSTTLAPDRCKICGSPDLRRLAHTAECGACHALLNYPYVDDRSCETHAATAMTPEFWQEWYAAAATRNHDNFTAMIRFAIGELATMAPLTVLDYSGAGGQFASVLRSLYPNARVFLTDIADEALLPQWRPLNTQIRFADFPTDGQRFDVIFLNDVFEHVNDPVGVLQLLASKLAPGGRIFIDTPRPSWLYPVLRVIAPPLHRKLLRGTVDHEHLQLWAKTAFYTAAQRANLKVRQYRELTEYTRGASFYLKGIGASNPLVRMGGYLFHRFSSQLRAHNKIMAVLAPA